MAFPFFPGGVIAASIALGGTIVLFRVLLLALDRGAAELRGSIGPGLVRGVTAWVEQPGTPGAATPAPAGPSRHRAHGAGAAPGWSMPAGAVLEDVASPPGIGTEVVRSRA